jgi:hypothetical protein
MIEMENDQKQKYKPLSTEEENLVREIVQLGRNHPPKIY